MKNFTQKYIFSALTAVALISCGRPTASINNMKFAASGNQTVEQVLEKDLINDIIAPETPTTAKLDSFVLVPNIAQNQTTQPIGTFYLPVNSQFQYIAEGSNTDMSFDFHLPANLTENDSVLLHYQLNGVQDFTALVKKINDNEVVGGRFAKTDTIWRQQTEELPYFSLKKGKNTIRYQLPNDLKYSVAIKDIQLQIIPKTNKNSAGIIVNQPESHSYYNTFGYLQGFVDDNNAKLTIDNKEVKTKNGFFEVIVNKNKEQGTKSKDEGWSSTIKVEYANGDILERDVTFKNSIDYDFATGGNYVAQSVKQDIFPNKNFDISLLGAKLLGNRNAVKDNKTLSITALRSIDMAVTSSDMINVTADAAGYRFLPDGLKFENQQVIALKYDTALLTQGYTPNDIFTFYYDESLRQWQRISRDSIDLANCIIYSHTDHFTDYINSIIKAPETPEVAAYTPTMLKDLQAAHPHNGISNFSVPEANNKGTANTSMPLWIPAGRNGMQPNLNLTYNSGGGNGWLGQGWDIPFSSIEVETRWGVPLYDLTEETETYLLDGETLVLDSIDVTANNSIVLKKPTYRRDLEKRTKVTTNDTTRFFRRIEGAFQKIERIGTNPKNYHFVVTNKDGSKMTYGNISSAKLTTIEGNIGKWFLTKIEDTYGNYYEIHYVTKNKNGGKQIYPDYINYTGHTNTNDLGKYKIKFVLSGDNVREDITSNGRKGLFEVNAHLLGRIDVLYNDIDTLRQYYFGYKEGAYGKTLLANVLDADSTFKLSQNINLFTKNDIFDRNATADNISNGDYYPIKYYFDYYNQATMQFTNDSIIKNVGNNSDYDVLNFGSAFPKRLFSSNATSALGTSTSFSAGGGASINFGFGPLAFLRSLALGGHFDVSYSDQATASTLIDINGDGYPDKLLRYKNNGKLAYRLFNPSNKTFGELVYTKINTSKFNYSDTWTPTFGFNLNFKVGSDQIGIGAALNLNFAFPTTNTSQYYADVDGDGFIDFIDNNKDGKILLNRLSTDGNFNANYGSSDTIWMGGSCGDEFILNDGSIDYNIFYKTVYDTIWLTRGRDFCSEKDIEKYYKHFVEKCDICNNHMCNIELNEDENFIFSMVNFHMQHDTTQIKYDATIAGICKFYYIDFTYQECIIEPIYQPEIEVVKCWVAPATGMIKIDGIVSLAEMLDTMNLTKMRELYDINDGVRASIQYNFRKQFNATEAYNKWLKREVVTPYNDNKDMSVDSVEVIAGDKLFFRLESLGKRALDVVEWNPVIEYIDIENSYVQTFFYKNNEHPAPPVPNIYNTLQSVDYNGVRNYKFDAKEDFIVNNGIEKHQMPLDGNIKIELKVNIDNASQNVILKMHKNNATSCTKTFAKNTVINFDTILIRNNIAKEDSIWFTMECPGEIVWSKVRAKAKVYYTYSADSNFPEVIDTISNYPDTVYTQSFEPRIYKRAVQYTKYRAIPFTYSNGYVNLIVTGTAAIRIDKYDLTTGNYESIQSLLAILSNSFILNSNPVNFSFTQGHQYLINVYVDNSMEDVMPTKAVLNVGSQYFSCGVHYTNYNPKSKWGMFHRNWTQFGYKSPTKGGDMIKEKYLNMDYEEDNLDQNDPVYNDIIEINTNMQPEEQVAGTVNPLSRAFFKLTPDYANNRYVGYGNTIWVSEKYMSNFNTAGDESYVAMESLPVAMVNTNAGKKPTTIPKHSSGYNFSLNANAGVSVMDENVGGIGGGYNRGYNEVKTDYMDINGDRYPDIVTEAGIQYSKQNGGLSNKTEKFTDNHFVYYSSLEGNVVNKNIGLPVLQPKIGSNPKGSVLMSMPTAGIGGNSSKDFAKKSWSDINGDGLPDKIDLENSNNKKVYYNLGYNFLPGSFNDLEDKIRETETSGSSGGISGNFDICQSISGGVSTGKSKSTTKMELVDVNADGLPDKVYVENNHIYVRYNTGSGFTSPKKLVDNSVIYKSEAQTKGINGEITFGFTIFGIVKFTVSPAINFGWTVSKDEAQFMDFNNDGYPDIVMANGSDNITVKYAIPQPNDLLQSIESSTNFKIEIGYGISENSKVDNPNRNWVMTKCNHYHIEPRFTANHVLNSLFEYENRKYNRFEREDYGYQKVRTKVMTDDNYYNHNHHGFVTLPYVYQIIDKYYNNSLYLTKGLLDSVVVMNAAGERFTKQETFYSANDVKTGTDVSAANAFCLGSVYPAVCEEKTYFYEGNNAPQITTQKTYKYGSYGNVKKYSNENNIASASDNISADISYYCDTVKYFVGQADSISYTAANNSNTYTKKAEIDNNYGTVTQITLNGDTMQKTNLEYDQYGNIAKTISHEGSAGRAYIEYEYDNILHALPVRAWNNLNYESTIDYDYRFQVPIKTTDIGGSEMRYTYDTKGRVKTIQSPKEIANGVDYTLKYYYWDMQEIESGSYAFQLGYLKWVKTFHYNSDFPNDDIEIVTHADGLGRIQRITKVLKTDNDIEKLYISGKKWFDFTGKIICEQVVPYEAGGNYYEETIISTFQGYNPDMEEDEEDAVLYKSYQYDSFGRQIKVIEPDSTETNMAYSIENSLFKTSVTDALNNTSHIHKDTRDLTFKTVSPLGATTTFEYDGLGQLKKTISPDGQNNPVGHETTYQYDNAGRTTRITHPSRGTTTWHYDGGTTQPSSEHNELGTITYEYDILGRPVKKEYSKFPINNVYYEYGNANAGLNAGKLIKLQDATGVSEFQYGNMGEVVGQTRMHILPNGSWLTHKTQWEYDSWGRTKSILYPDHERVDYFYNNAGLLDKVTSTYNGDYISKTVYNKNEQKDSVFYGNNTYRTYTYDTVMQRLTESNLYKANNSVLFHKQYAYDNIGNIINLQDSLGTLNLMTPRPPNTMSLDINHSYEYDEDNRLIAANASNGSNLYYDLYMDYSPSGRIIHKNLTGSGRIGKTTTPINFVNNYSYNQSNNPYAVRKLSMGGLINSTLSWDDAGNLCYRTTRESDQHYYWTEDNRMQAYYDTGNGVISTGTIAHYRYDAGGERDLKLVGQIQDINIMGVPYRMPDYTDATLYASPLVTVNKNGYVKHYFAETERILSNVGGGKNSLGTINVYSEIFSISEDNAEELSNNFTNFASAYLDEVNKTSCMQNDINYYAYMENIPQLAQIFHNAVNNMPNSDVPYYFNADHLSGASMITNSNGEMYRTLAYCPFGEDFINVDPGFLLIGGLNLEHRFTGHIKDNESGLYYAHARYVWDGLPISTDPMWYKYPHITSYNWCGQNPIMITDPTGMKWDDEEAAAALRKSAIDIKTTLVTENTGYSDRLKSGGELTSAETFTMEQNRHRISGLEKSIADIDLLGADQNNTYTLTSSANTTSGYVEKLGNGNISIAGDGKELSLHEIAHVRQSLNNGGLVFNDNNRLTHNPATAINACISELDAYTIQWSFNPISNSVFRDLPPTLNQIGNIKNSDGTYTYPNIRRALEIVPNLHNLIRR